jgi:general secretion pathway protein F
MEPSVARFSFAAFTQAGERTSGVIEADSLVLALELLRQRGLQPYATELAQTDRTQRATPSRSAKTLKWQAESCQQLSTLLSAGVGLDKAITLLLTSAKFGKPKAFLTAVLEKVSAGQPLSQALAEGRLALPPDQVGLLQAAESSGHLAKGLSELATQLQGRLEFRAAMISAFLYPAFLVCLAPLSLLFIGLILVPNLAPVFADSGAPMPFVLAAMLWIGQTVKATWPALAALVLLTVLLIVMLRHTIRERLQALAYRLPGLRRIMRQLLLVRVSRTLGTLLSAGLSLQSALRHTQNTVAASTDRDALQAAERAIANGSKLSSALGPVRCFDATARQMIAVGEETNNLGPLLLHIAQSEEGKLKASMERLKTLLSPILTLVMGLMIGSIVISIMRAILSVNELAIR